VTVIELVDSDLARVETGGRTEIVSVALVEAGPGDVVLVHAGEAIASLGPDGGGPAVVVDTVPGRGGPGSP
jgi:hydrogenase expression/formation protein HypC